MKKIFRKNQLVITALALMIAVAGYFSYMNNNMDDGKIQTAAEAANAEVSAGGTGLDGDSGSNGWKRRDSGGHGGRTCSGRNRADSGRWNSRGRGSRQSGRGGAHQYDRCQYRLCFGNEIKP